MTLAHFLGVKGFHVEYLAMGVSIGLLGGWMWRTGSDKRGGIIMVVVGALLSVAAFLVS